MINLVREVGQSVCRALFVGLVTVLFVAFLSPLAPDGFFPNLYSSLVNWSVFFRDGSERVIVSVSETCCLVCNSFQPCVIVWTDVVKLADHGRLLGSSFVRSHAEELLGIWAFLLAVFWAFHPHAARLFLKLVIFNSFFFRKLFPIFCWAWYVVTDGCRVVADYAVTVLKCVSYLQVANLFLCIWFTGTGCCKVAIMKTSFFQYVIYYIPIGSLQ